MKRALAVLLFAVLALAAVAVSPVSAQGDEVSVSVSFESHDVSDGERVEIGPTHEIKVVVTARSENEMNTVEARLHNTTVAQGINGTSHNVSHALTTHPGSNFYTVRVTDMEGNVATSTINFYRIPTNPVQVKRVVERLQERKVSIEQDVSSLRERKQSLQEENRDLKQRRQELEEELVAFDSPGSAGEGDGEGDDEQTGGTEPESLPGFTSVVALVAVAVAVGAVAAGVRRRRRR